MLLAFGLLSATTATTAGSGKIATTESDSQITEQIRTALYKNPSIASNDISVQTRDGVVYLRGLVDTNVERADIEALARGMAGVKRVVDSLELRNDVR